MPCCLDGSLGRWLNRRTRFVEATTGEPVGDMNGVPMIPHDLRAKASLVDIGDFANLLSQAWRIPQSRVAVTIAANLDDPQTFPNVDAATQSLKSGVKDKADDYDWDAIAADLVDQHLIAHTTDRSGCYLVENIWAAGQWPTPTADSIIRQHDLAGLWQTIRCHTGDSQTWAAIPAGQPEPTSTTDALCRAAGFGDTRNQALVAAAHAGDTLTATFHVESERHRLLFLQAPAGTGPNTPSHARHPIPDEQTPHLTPGSPANL